jgi:hypothetical protein
VFDIGDVLITFEAPVLTVIIIEDTLPEEAPAIEVIGDDIELPDLVIELLIAVLDETLPRAYTDMSTAASTPPAPGEELA